MPDVTMVATKNFSYSTRRLKAGDEFTVSERDAKILKAIGKAEAPRIPGTVPAPPAEVLRRAATVTPPSPKVQPKRRSRRNVAKKG